MKKVCFWSVKGGTGKSTTCAQTGLALQRKGYKVGFLDVDCTGSNLPAALNIPIKDIRNYKPELHTAKQVMSAVKVNGIEVFSLSFRFGDAALMWQGGERKIKAFGQEFDMTGTGTYQLVKQMLTNVEFSSDLDWLLYDLPPTSSDMTLSLFENITDLWGVILVCQPTNLAVQDIERTLNMIEVKHIPLLGMVGNMVYAIAPKSKEEFCPFLDAGIDLVSFCSKRGIPYLAGIPLTPEHKAIDVIFDRLTERIIEAQPVRIWERSFKQRLQEGVARGIVKGMFRS